MADLSSERKSLIENTVEELLQMADEFDAMAATASTQDARQALRRLAARFRIFAAGRVASRRGPSPVTQGKPSSRNGTYQLRNVFGIRADDEVQGRQARARES